MAKNDLKFKEFGDRMKDMRKDAGYDDQDSIASALGVERNTYTQYERGRSMLPARLIPKFCRLTKKSEAFFLTGKGVSPGLDLKGTPVIGEVQAGVWREAVQWDESQTYHISAPLGRYANANAYALVIRGDSMDQIYREGEIVIVVPLTQYDAVLKSGLRVIVERRKSDGIVEATAKELIITEDSAELWPRSSNPKFQKPLEIHWPHQGAERHDAETIEIKGVIVASYRSENI